MMFFSSLMVGIDLLIVILGGGFGMGSGIFSGNVLAGGGECLFDEEMVKVV